MNDNRTGPKLAIGCGGLLLVLAFCTAAFGAFHVFVDRGGAISADEAMPALLGGVLCMFVDVILVGIGVAMLLRAPGVVGGTTVPMPTSSPGAASGTPWHLATGCGSLFFVVTLCLSLGGMGYAYSELERWESNRDEDLAMGGDPMILMIDEHAIQERSEMLGASSCCCVFSFFFAAACAGGTFALVRRRRAGAS